MCADCQGVTKSTTSSRGTITMSRTWPLFTQSRVTAERPSLSAKQNDPSAAGRPKVTPDFSEALPVSPSHRSVATWAFSTASSHRGRFAVRGA